MPQPLSQVLEGVLALRGRTVVRQDLEDLVVTLANDHFEQGLATDDGKELDVVELHDGVLLGGPLDHQGLGQPAGVVLVLEEVLLYFGGLFVNVVLGQVVETEGQFVLGLIIDFDLGLVLLLLEVGHLVHVLVTLLVHALLVVLLQVDVVHHIRQLQLLLLLLLLFQQRSRLSRGWHLRGHLLVLLSLLRLLVVEVVVTARLLHFGLFYRVRSAHLLGIRVLGQLLRVVLLLSQVGDVDLLGVDDVDWGGLLVAQKGLVALLLLQTRSVALFIEDREENLLVVVVAAGLLRRLLRYFLLRELQVL